VKLLITRLPLKKVRPQTTKKIIKLETAMELKQKIKHGPWNENHEFF
jgi:hypothetical protein